MYLEEEDTPRIVEIEDDGLDFVSDVKGLANCHEPPLWLSPFLLFFSRLFSFLFIAWESLSHYVTQVVTMSHHGHGHNSRHMVTW